MMQEVLLRWLFVLVLPMLLLGCATPASMLSQTTPTPVVQPGTYRLIDFYERLPDGSETLFGEFIVSPTTAPQAQSEVCGGTDRGDSVLLLDSRPFRNVEARSYVRVASGHGERRVGLAVRYSKPHSFYLASVDGYGGRARIIRVDAGSPVILAEDVYDFQMDKWHDLRFIAIANTLTLEIDNHRVIAALDERYTDGGTALWTGKGSLGCFALTAIAEH
jgi:hypothetical protein